MIMSSLSANNYIKEITDSRKWAIIVYLALSLFAIMGCINLVDIVSGDIIGTTAIYSTYAGISLSAALGVGAFYLFFVRLPQGKWQQYTLIAVFSGAFILVAAFALVNSTGFLWTLLIVFYTLVGFNTGICAFCFFILYSHTDKSGRILAWSSLMGLSIYYLFCLLCPRDSIVYFPVWQISIGVAIIAMLLLLLRPIKVLEVLSLDAKNIEDNNNPKFRISVGANVMMIIIMAFLMGGNDAIILAGIDENRSTIHITQLFYVLGIMLAGYIADLGKGKYLHVLCLAAVILTIPITLYVNSPTDYILNSGFTYFLGGIFFIVVIFCLISIADQALNPLLIICLPGFLYYLGGAMGGMAVEYIIHLDDVWLLIIYTFIILLFLGSIYGAGFLRVDAGLNSNIPRPDLTLEQKLNFITRTFNLTLRETQVLQELQKGRSNSEIAADLFISENTVKFHVRNILKKLNIENRYQVNIWLEENSNGINV